jgi:hypothetical protein
VLYLMYLKLLFVHFNAHGKLAFRVTEFHSESGRSSRSLKAMRQAAEERYRFGFDDQVTEMSFPAQRIAVKGIAQCWKQCLPSMFSFSDSRHAAIMRNQPLRPSFLGDQESQTACRHLVTEAKGVRAKQ